MFTSAACQGQLLKWQCDMWTEIKPFKVAKHSFRVQSCWCDSAPAQGLQKQTCRWYSDHFLCSMRALSLLIFFVIELNALMALVFYNKCMLEKVTMQRTQQFSDFSIHRKNPVKWSACTVARKIETDCFCISDDPVAKISRKLAKNSSQTKHMIYHEKSEFWCREFSIIQKTINGELRKSPMSKFY